MTRSRLAGLAAAVLLLGACGKKDAEPGAAPADSTAAAASATPAPEAAAPTGIGGTPAAAQRGVDSAEAAYRRQESAVDSLSQQAGGATP
ncbi:hypothetical protein [Longimicrobium sp.]|uniref:hypothetical protein n=1 Tax=Longimicrobium sp. TaxID=2029185 RepID=UPI002C8BA526|nr:hypothetical protein [Longimicrobium sp.]HSU14517.1 hypothetical protein [Longimicrobium sp.]